VPEEDVGVPTYQYACTACGEQLEAVQAFTDPALTECPACGGALRKVYSAVGVVFKGSGFYKNDSRTPVKTPDTGGKTDGGKTDSGKSDGGKSGDGAGGGTTEKAPAAKSEGSSRSPSTPSTSSTPVAKSA
jgi:putative FmdB family regulatory protein